MKLLVREYYKISYIVKSKKGVTLEIIEKRWSGSYRYLDFNKDEIELCDCLDERVIIKKEEEEVENDFYKISNDNKFIQFSYPEKCLSYTEKCPKNLKREFVRNDFILGRVCRIPENKFIERRYHKKYVEVGKWNSINVVLGGMPFDEAIEFLKDKFWESKTCG